MEQLDLRFYPHQEIGIIVGAPDTKDGHFSEKVKTRLNNWGYQYQWHNAKGVTITKRPETAEEQLKELMIRQFGIDIQVDINAFAHFIFLLLTEEDFRSMPWDERTLRIRERFGFTLTYKRMHGWTQTLVEHGVIDRIRERQNPIIWKSWRNEQKEIERKQLNEEDPEYQEYKQLRKELIATSADQNGNMSKETWEYVGRTLWKRFHFKCYSCFCYEPNGIGHDVDEVIRWADGICTKDYEDE